MRIKTILALTFGMLWPLAAHAIDAGTEAPDFTKMSSQGQVRLSDYEGRKNVVLALYFAVFTPV